MSGIVGEQVVGGCRDAMERGVVWPRVLMNCTTDSNPRKWEMNQLMGGPGAVRGLPCIWLWSSMQTK